MSANSLRVLVVDDEPEIQRFLRASLKVQQYEVYMVETGRRAVEETARLHPDLLILDLGLPDIDGVEVTRKVREWSQIPIIILSVRNAEKDKIEALDAGADDYLTKPFGVGELMARIRAIMRHKNLNNDEPILQTGKLRMDISRHKVTLEDHEIILTHTEFDLLRVLLQNAGKVMTHRQLMYKVWGPGYENESRLLRVNISNLRHKIESDPNQPFYIQTELGVGYRLREE
jgi:two-component system KDP operon response regulator KdpE